MFALLCPGEGSSENESLLSSFYMGPQLLSLQKFDDGFNSVRFKSNTKVGFWIKFFFKYSSAFWFCCSERRLWFQKFHKSQSLIKNAKIQEWENLITFCKLFINFKHLYKNSSMRLLTKKKLNLHVFSKCTSMTCIHLLSIPNKQHSTYFIFIYKRFRSEPQPNWRRKHFTKTWSGRHS